jgi:hypothetical protein
MHLCLYANLALLWISVAENRIYSKLFRTTSILNVNIYETVFMWYMEKFMLVLRKPGFIKEQ